MTLEQTLSDWAWTKLTPAQAAELPDDAVLEIVEERASSWGYCETCGPDPDELAIKYQGETVAIFYMTLGDAIQEILQTEKQVAAS